MQKTDENPAPEKPVRSDRWARNVINGARWLFGFGALFILLTSPRDIKDWSNAVVGAWFAYCLVRSYDDAALDNGTAGANRIANHRRSLWRRWLRKPDLVAMPFDRDIADRDLARLLHRARLWRSVSLTAMFGCRLLLVLIIVMSLYTRSFWDPIWAWAPFSIYGIVGLKVLFPSGYFNWNNDPQKLAQKLCESSNFDIAVALQYHPVPTVNLAACAAVLHTLPTMSSGKVSQRSRMILLKYLNRDGLKSGDFFVGNSPLTNEPMLRGDLNTAIIEASPRLFGIDELRSKLLPELKWLSEQPETGSVPQSLIELARRTLPLVEETINLGWDSATLPRAASGPIVDSLLIPATERQSDESELLRPVDYANYANRHVYVIDDMCEVETSRNG